VNGRGGLVIYYRQMDVLNLGPVDSFGGRREKEKELFMLKIYVS
jgi:hypothetical protein